MTRVLPVLILLTMAVPAYAGMPGDGVRGKALHDANRLGCHNTEVYRRQDRHVRSLAALEQQLVSCAHAAKKNFSATEQQDLLQYLNEHFYEFH